MAVIYAHAWALGMGVADTGDKSPRIWSGDANANAPLQILSYRYKQERFLAFKISQNPFPAEALPPAPLTTLPKPPSRLGMGTPFPIPCLFCGDVMWYRAQGEDGGSSSSSSSSHRVAALASALADKMLESPEMVRLLEGDMSSLKTATSAPKSVL